MAKIFYFANKNINNKKKWFILVLIISIFFSGIIIQKLFILSSWNLYSQETDYGGNEFISRKAHFRHYNIAIDMMIFKNTHSIVTCWSIYSESFMINIFIWFSYLKFSFFKILLVFGWVRWYWMHIDGYRKWLII